jgi:thymidylate synthase
VILSGLANAVIHFFTFPTKGLCVRIAERINSFKRKNKMSLKARSITATDLPDAWFQTVYDCLEHGRKREINEGSFAGGDNFRLEFDFIAIRIINPGYPKDRQSDEDLLPKIPVQYGLPDPVSPGYLASYVPYLLTGEIAEGESYTYGSRLSCYETDNFPPNMALVKDYFRDQYNTLQTENSYFIDQVGYMIDTYKTGKYYNNQMILQVAEPSDIILKDPPCLRHIDTKIVDGKLHFFPYFRSWDIFSGLPANLAVIQILKEYMASEIGIGDGEIIATSKGAHLYNHVLKLAETIRGKTIEEFKKGE